MGVRIDYACHMIPPGYEFVIKLRGNLSRPFPAVQWRARGSQRVTLILRAMFYTPLWSRPGSVSWAVKWDARAGAGSLIEHLRITRDRFLRVFIDGALA